MGVRLISVVVFHLLVSFAFVSSNECDKKITRRTFYSNRLQTVKVENYFGRVLVKKHSSDSEARVLVEVNLVGTLLHAANPPILFTDDGGQAEALVMVGPLAEDSSSTKPSPVNTWMLSLPLIGALLFQRRAFVLALLTLFSIWLSVTVAQDGSDGCPIGDVEVFMPRNSCLSVTNSQDGRSTSVNVVECKEEDQPQVVSCSVSGYLYPNCTEGSAGIRLSWDVMFSAATNDTLPTSDTPILIEWSLRPVNCPTCTMVTSFTTILELHEVADIRNFHSWSKTVSPDDLQQLTNGSAVTFLLRVDTPREGYSISRECYGKAPDGSTVFTNAVPFNPGPLTGQLSFNTTTFNAHQTVVAMTANEVCFLLRGFENGVCDIASYRASLGTTVCGTDSINFTTLPINKTTTVQACLQSDGDLDIGRYFVTIEAVDHTNLSTMVCPDVSFVVDNTPPQFVSINTTCFTRNDNIFEERLSWDIQALSGIVAIRYNISSTNLVDSPNFVLFPMPVEPHQLGYNIQPLLQGRTGNVQYFTLQAESRVGLTMTHTIQADQICSNN